jgi:hypothetical protein
LNWFCGADAASLTPVHDDSFIAAKFVGTDFNSVSRNADALDITTPGVGCRNRAADDGNHFWGISLKRWLSSPVVWSLIILILSGVGILRELL